MSTITRETRAMLRLVAADATPGPYAVEGESADTPEASIKALASGRYVAVACSAPDDADTSTEDNACFLALAGTVALPLLDTLEQAERELAEARAHVGVLREALEREHEWLDELGCDCGTDEPEMCAWCVGRAALATVPAGLGAEREALLALERAMRTKWSPTAIKEALAAIDAARAGGGK